MVTEPSGPLPPVSACDGGGDGDRDGDGAGGGDGRFDGAAARLGGAGEEHAVSVTAPAASTANTSRREVIAGSPLQLVRSPP
jgi:hypothetical protein